MKRKLENQIKEKLVNSDLWINKLKFDCEKQKTFLAIRNNYVDLYHKGGRLFNFDNRGFKTHLKYAAVIESNGNDYLTESELLNCKLASNFETNYSRIKENCANYTGIEAYGVSEIYHKHSYLSDSNVVILDIEISFESLEKGRKQDRIDILLLNKATKTLQFVEAKHFSNPEIWSTGIPHVISQIKRYESQIKQRENEIILEYIEYIENLNNLFNLSLPAPVNVDNKVTLLIFGFDKDQRDGRLKSLIKNNDEFEGVRIYAKGDVKTIVSENLWC